MDTVLFTRMNTNTAIAIIIALVVVIGGFMFYGNQPVATVNEVPAGKASMVPYENASYDLSFQYPSNLYLHERTDAGTPERPQLSLFLVADTHENRDLLSGKITEPREGPTGITVDVYQNPEELSASDWLKNDTTWTVANSTAAPITVGAHEGVSFTWSGLYEGKNVLLTQGDKAYVFTVTWMTPDDQIIRDFDMVLNSLSI